MPKTVFYVRVSTREQNPASQIDAAKRLGVKTQHIFVEKASGSRHERPILAEALQTLEAGDTLACFKLDRIGRSLVHLTKLLDDLKKRDVHFRTVDDHLDTRGSTGKLLLHILASIAEFERDLIIDRTRAGLATARKSGKRLGAPVKFTPDMVAMAKRYFEKGLNADEVARQLKISRRTLFRGLRAARDHDDYIVAS
ncbi:MAG TPA: recombinase family protein [Hyphomicrobium sp.]|jgi:DNA invertase Pin-like site-specific DNA recombinase|nr:recombinase family protein [Hyphomicrobium sp.]